MTEQLDRTLVAAVDDGPVAASRRRYAALEIAEILGRPAPTPEQVAVIEADPASPLLVIAGAGSGKTETMASRVVWLIANGHVRPEEVLGLTFTRKAAGELALRVQDRLAQFARRTGAAADGLALLDRPTVSTYNAYAAGLVGDHALRLGIEPGSRLLSEASQWQLAAEVVESWAGDLGTDAAVSSVIDAVRSLSGALAEHLLEPVEARARLERLADGIAAVPLGRRKTHYADVTSLLGSLGERARLLDVVAAYAERKRRLEALDFGDQVAIAARLAREVPVVGRLERGRYRAVLLDEYQDTSHAQVELLAALFGAGHGVTAVGDPNQSIYGWRGASAGGIGRFPERFRQAPTAASPHGARARVLSLSTSWRNDRAILDVANRTAEPLRASSQVPVDRLAARPGAGEGAVHVTFLATEDEEAAHLADVVARARDDAAAAGRSMPSAAVLCRARRQFLPVEAALRARGIPVEVVGLGGLLSTPEVTDLVAFLQVAHDPSRGDALARLLTGPRVNLGAADLFALASRARDLADAQDRARADGAPDDAPPEPEPDPEDGAEPAILEGDVVDHRSLVDALDDLPAPGRAARDGRTLTTAAHTRLATLARDLRAVRAQTYLSLPELVTQAERALGLDIEVDVAGALFDAGAQGGSELGRAHLDAFRDVALEFSQSADVPTLGAFLAWLGAAQAQEGGLDLPLRDVDPDAVQVITVHGAKGLEWDLVVVPGLVQQAFPQVRFGDDGPTDSGWLTGLGNLPYPLRGDARDLPHLAYDDAEDATGLRDALAAFKLACGEHELAEERRLAYVAFTRARHELHLSGSWWRTGTRPSEPSVFLTELVDAGLRPEMWADVPEDGASNPLADRVRTGWWPAIPDDDAARGHADPAAEPGPSPAVRAVRAAADAVREAVESGASALATDDARHAPDDPDGLVALARLLLAERATHEAARAEVAFPAHVSASGLVALAADRDAFALARRRPVPRRPSSHARRGTAFHAWVERYFGAAALLDVEDLPGADDADVRTDEELDALRTTFLASRWASREPLAIEVDVETPVAGVVVRCRIDAVFPDRAEPRGDDPDGTRPAAVVVDWKTGRAPHDEASRRAREVQLAAYRLAWSRWSGLPLADVSAAFYYVADDTTERPVDLLDETALEALVRGVR
ncbi:ATP-dependent DNA helicase [Luteimicrobium xylanilyticum]|uniref:DNA 3'-5' helicase n=1 Tax=Luteimicrobium xylanilyticum TaxID=1133546 RepID=A0A5P9Q7U3_9MICO|nr:ATP-dependent DNA helicase [Luteimicrobium xylanilyticum]QFU97507.1 DNA helicase [Luteimicrobium xylanilyticum]